MECSYAIMVLAFPDKKQRSTFSFHLPMDQVEMETLMWSIRSTHDRVTAKGVPLRVMRQEVMHYLVQLRSDKPSTVVDEWQARRWRHREAHKKKIKTEFEKALHGQRFVLTHEEIERCGTRFIT